MAVHQVSDVRCSRLLSFRRVSALICHNEKEREEKKSRRVEMWDKGEAAKTEDVKNSSGT